MCIFTIGRYKLTLYPAKLRHIAKSYKQFIFYKKQKNYALKILSTREKWHN